jgi:hypothetical protein
MPIGTPFTLTGIANDPDACDQLTYIWDQLDGDKPKNLLGANDLEGAIFLRLLPNPNTSITFKDMDSIIANRFATTTEQLPMHSRDLNFRLTVNDNHQFAYDGVNVNASGVHSDYVKISVVDYGGPFNVTSKQNPGRYIGGSTQVITWNVNGTNETPIGVENVIINLSCDGGKIFPTVLANNTTNRKRSA